MNQPNEFEKLFRKSDVNVEPQLDKKIMDDALPYLEQAANGISTRHINWRTIMNSKITRLATAAAIVIAATVMLCIFAGPTSVVLADVVEKVQQYDKIIQHETRVMTPVGQQQPGMTTQVKKYISTEYGMVEEQYLPDGSLLTSIYLLKENGKMLMVIHPSKQYFSVSFNETSLEFQESFNARGYVEFIFKCDDYIKLGQKEIDGRKVEGFEAKDPPFVEEISKMKDYPFKMADSTWRIWVDQKTKLPVKAESQITLLESVFTENKKVRINADTYDIQWNAEFDDSVFTPNIPDDYTELDMSTLTQ
jgi:outer membrane lipoprotein-sorting protein